MFSGVQDKFVKNEVKFVVDEIKFVVGEIILWWVRLITMASLLKVILIKFKG